MNKNIIIRTVIEGLIGWVLLALVVSYAKDMTFAQAFIAPHTLVMPLQALSGDTSVSGKKQRSRQIFERRPAGENEDPAAYDEKYAAGSSSFMPFIL